MISTETTVREEIVKAIKAIAKADLGLEPSKIYDYLREYHPPEKDSNFLSADVDGAKTFRAWGVQVLPDDEILEGAPGVIYSRLYEVTIRGYYKLVNGSDLNTLIDHARKIRGALKTLGIRFNGTVNLIESISPFSPSIEESEDGRLLVVSIVYRLRSLSPDY